MKKLLVLVLMLVLVIGLASCEKEEVVVEQEATLVSVEEFTVDVISSYEYMAGEVVYTYKHIVGYQDTKQQIPIFKMVVSKDLYEIGDTFNVATIDLGNFDYHVIQFEDGTLDTSWHKYLEVI